MLKIENVVTPSAEQIQAVIRGMRNPKNSWDKSDSEWTRDYEKKDCFDYVYDYELDEESVFEIGSNDRNLMMNLASAGPVHGKFRRMIPVYLDITAPLYWWKEFDTYKVGTVANSCSTMHKIQAKEFTLDDFSCEHLHHESVAELLNVIRILNNYRDLFNDWDHLNNNDWDRLNYNAKNAWDLYDRKEVWWQMIQLLPTSYNQRRTVMLNYEVLSNIYKYRRNHKLDEWHTFCDWALTLPYSEIILADIQKEAE